jgi:PKD repeat protein
VFVYNNVMYNPPENASQWEQMAIQGNVTPPSDSNIPLPDVVDRNLQIRGNMIWNGPPDLPLNGGDGCRPENLACNETQILRDNTINQLEPELISPDHNDFTPGSNSTVLYSPAYAIPPFPGNDRPSPPLAPQGNLNNLVPRDYFGNLRGEVSYAGAILPVSSPVANFSGSPVTGPAPLLVAFTDLSAHNPVTWNWTFGDGSPGNATERNPVHAYTHEGIYTVSLNVTNAAGSNTTTKTVYITVTRSTALVADFTASVTIGRAPLTVQFNDTSTGLPTNWNWSFGDANASALQNPVHTYRQGGSYSVVLTVTDNTGATNTSRAFGITIFPLGDFNSNWRVDIGDVTRVAYIAAGLLPEDLNADFDASGHVEVGDAAKIAWYYVGKIPEL